MDTYIDVVSGEVGSAITARHARRKELGLGDIELNPPLVGVSSVTAAAQLNDAECSAARACRDRTRRSRVTGGPQIGYCTAYDEPAASASS